MPKILAIDDKMDNLVTLSALLKNLMPDCAVIIAQSGMEGIGKAKTELPDAILLDVKMPEMDGFETCRRLMSDQSTMHVPVIMMTAIKTDPESRIKGLDVGANTFLAKPIDEAELVSQVKVALRIKKAEDALREERHSLERTVQERTADLRQEITERKRAEEAFRESEERFRLLAESARDTIWTMDMNLRYIYMSPYVKQTLDYTPEDYMTMPLNKMLTPSSLKLCMQVLAEELEIEKCDDKDLLRSRTVEVELIHRNGKIVPAEIKMTFMRNAAGQTTGILGYTRDITERKHAAEKLQHTLDSLRKAVSATIHVMVSAVETRDPYTAGHQIRSANLARAIASEMGLISQDQIDAIRMAGSIHDIGKLSIPAEILSKPTKLSELEFSLIKEHARQGYEILGNVESPWPLAEMVYQHHERMDGSGYPRNLKGEDILIEARILAVADVVESMASHRPYRPTLGIDVALEEIEKNSGTLYDRAVADACLRLFREKGFQLEGT
jgi:PAS domain S-box-containing protein